MYRVISCIVGKGCLLWPVCSLDKALLAFALLHFVLQGQTCLLFQVSLDFLLLHYNPLWWKGHLFFFLDMNLSKLWEIVQDRGVWRAIVQGVAKSWIWLSNWTTTVTKKSRWCRPNHCMTNSKITVKADCAVSAYRSSLHLWKLLLSDSQWGGGRAVNL